MRSGFVLVCLLVFLAAGLSAESLTLDQALKEAIDKNLNLMAERFNVSIADARILQAGLRPNPVLAYGQDYQNVFGTGITPQNSGGPTEWNVRADFPIERGKKREARVELNGKISTHVHSVGPPLFCGVMPVPNTFW